MNGDTTAATTNVVGFFNPNQYRIYIEISELNLKCELNPGQYVRDRAGRYINDPIFENYVQPKGLSKSTSPTPVSINWVPRFVKSVRPAHSVTQATGFVRQPDGQVVPSYAQDPTRALPEIAINKVPHLGMTVARARELGFIGKPRLVPEDFGTTDTSGAPQSSKELPDIRYSIESPPKLRTAAPMTPELTAVDERIAPVEAVRRVQLQQGLNRAAQVASPENFDPSRVKAVASVRLVAPDQPTSLSDLSSAQPIQSRRPVSPGVSHAPAPIASSSPAIPQRILPKRVAAVVQEPPPAEPAEGQDQTLEQRFGILQPIQESGMPDPVLEPPPATEEQDDKRFICLADGKHFKFRSELERYVKRKYPATADDLMNPYPAEG
jgi:hypothetical protein